MKENEAEQTKGKFSVGLGLFDYINPILYGITVITIMIKLHGAMSTAAYVIFMIGAVMSLVFGLAIPTGKLLVGLGKVKFRLPVKLVSFVNTGILLSGIALSGYVLNIKPLIFVFILLAAAALLGLLWYKTGKFNSAAVMLGAVGYLMIYASFITMSIRKGMAAPVFFCAFSICLMVFLCLIGIKANLKDANVHWKIEITNVTCQLSVAIATLLLLCR